MRRLILLFCVLALFVSLVGCYGEGTATAEPSVISTEETTEIPAEETTTEASDEVEESSGAPTEEETEAPTQENTTEQTEETTEAALTEEDTTNPTEEDTTAPLEETTDVTTETTEEQTDEVIESCADHVDVDNNGLCDECEITVVVVIDIFAINDLHGKICDSSAQPGVDEMTTYIKNARQNNDHVIVLSSGDMWQGSSESNLTRGLIVTEWMNYLDFDSMTIGNHEYDWGEEFIEANAEIAEFPFLAINIYDNDTGERADYCTPSVMVERGGATIGIIGAIGNCYSSISKEFSGGVHFKVGSELTELVKAEALRLREAGADFIIYSIHGGYAQATSGVTQVADWQISGYYNTVLSDGYVDLVFEGHTHYGYVLRDSKGVYHLQNGGDNRGISYAEAVVNFANGENSIREARYIYSSEYSSLKDDPIVDELLVKYNEQVSEGSRVLGNNRYRRGDSELRQLVAQLYLEAGLEAFGDEYDIVLGGGFISIRSPKHLPAGEVTFSQVQGLFPFENTLVLCSVKGSDLLRSFINTNNDNYFVSYSNYGNSVKGSINPNATYYIITDTYCSTYAPNRLTEVKRYTAGVYAQQLLAKYIQSGGLE